MNTAIPPAARPTTDDGSACRHPAPAPSLDPDIQRSIETQRIMDVVNALATSADAGDWEGLRACMADQIVVDYTSLSGGLPGEMTADTLVDTWKFLSGFQATQHMIASHRVAVHGETATCKAYVVAHHYLPNNTGGAFWRLGGRYHEELVKSADGWKICRITLTVLWTEGNADLLTLAGQRYRALSGAPPRQ
ncbi:MAG: nuclear transport factor 2 family protein [Chloroflexi bacterium]|nr:nuclear transport factor 2 family protein [Chloroflexota bacterium]